MLIKICSRNNDVSNYIVYKPSELIQIEVDGKPDIEKRKGKIKSAGKNNQFNNRFDEIVYLSIEKPYKKIETLTLDGLATVTLKVALVEKTMKRGDREIPYLRIETSKEIITKNTKKHKVKDENVNVSTFVPNKDDDFINKAVGKIRK